MTENSTLTSGQLAENQEEQNSTASLSSASDAIENAGPDSEATEATGTKPEQVADQATGNQADLQTEAVLPAEEETTPAEPEMEVAEPVLEPVAVEPTLPVAETESAEPVAEVLEVTHSEKSHSEAESTVGSENQEVEMLMVGEQEMEEMESQDAEAQVEDFSGLDKEQLVKVVEQLNRDADANVAYRSLQKIKPLFDALYQKEKTEALEKFEAEGNDPTTFEFKHAGLEVRFQQAIKGIYDKRKISQDFQVKEKAKNLEAKLTLLDSLRQLVDDHEHTPGYDKFKEIREEWKKIGSVGPEHAQNLNASFYSLIERFYSLSEIYHNLRDFDRKKNLDMKLELVAKIEKLADEPMISKAMKDLMNYQDEYRSLGPVPKDKLDELKLRLKTAVDAIYDRRRAFNEERKHKMAEETSLKEAIVQKIAGFEAFIATNSKDWQAKTKELIALQEEWKQIPNHFREKTAELNKQFWGTFKKFMHAKNEFYKELDKGKKEVIAQKQNLVNEVNELKDGIDFDGIANRMKELQQAWKAAAPVYGKEGQKLYDDFKAGIDHFFTRLREQRSGEDKIQGDNLAIKETICAEIEALAESGKGTKARVDELKEKFRNAGFVPMKAMQQINSRFSKAMMSMIDKADQIADNEKERLKISLLTNRSTYSSEGVKNLRNQEGYIQKRLQQLRKDVGNLEDNVSMFKMSKNAMALIEDVQKRINLSKMEIKELENQLKEIRQADKA